MIHPMKNYQSEKSTNKKKYKKLMNVIVDKVKDYKLPELDKSRIINNKDKEIVWNNSKSHSNFDKALFRIDILGNIGIKNICYNNNFYNKYFAIEYEHFISYNHYGKTSKSNTCILNAGVNRSKGAKPLYEYNFEEYNGLSCLYGVSAEDLLKELKDDLHNTCKKYNLHFKKKNGVWTLLKNPNGKYKEYTNEYLNFPVNIKVNSKTEMVIATVAIVSTFNCLNNGVEYTYKNYLKPKLTDEKETTILDKIITTGTSIVMTGLSVLAVVAAVSKSSKD